jgi:hypothetical protein
MRDFDDSTLWRISAYERFRAEAGHSGFARLDGPSVLPTTLHAELSALGQHRLAHDALEVIAACIRQRESALLLLRNAGLVWPLTLFPRVNLYHLPRAVIESLSQGSRDLEVLEVEPPGLRPPGHVMHERVADAPGYRPLPPLLWALALHAPGGHLLRELTGRAAYRLAADFVNPGSDAGAIGPALQRLRREIASLADMAAWPGMDAERAARLLNAVYLQGGLIILRSHRQARETDAPARGLAGWWRSRR